MKKYGDNIAVYPEVSVILSNAKSRQVAIKAICRASSMSLSEISWSALLTLVAQAYASRLEGELLVAFAQAWHA